MRSDIRERYNGDGAAFIRFTAVAASAKIPTPLRETRPSIRGRHRKAET
jgi:hypothetical protein